MSDLLTHLAGTDIKVYASRLLDPKFKAYIAAITTELAIGGINPIAGPSLRAVTHAVPKDVSIAPVAGDNHSSIQGAVNGLSAGDTLRFADGTYKVTGQIAMKPGITFKSANPRKAFLDFIVPKDPGTLNGANYAFRGDMSDVTFDGMEIRSNNGIFSAGNLSRAIFRNNGFQHGADGTYYNRLVWYTGGNAAGLIIESNYFHDSPNSDRTLEIWNWSEGSYSFNTFDTVNDGGHIMNPGHGLQIKGNRFKKLRRMSIEVQQDKYPPSIWCERFTYEDNVIESRRLPYWDSMGASIPLAGIGVAIRNNYFNEFPYDGVWGDADSSGHQRGSYGIEAPQAPAGQAGGIVENNIIVSDRCVAAVACPGKDTIVRNNKFYGPFAWGVVFGEPGSLGGGNAVEVNNLKDPNAAHAPPIPGGTTPPPPTQMNLTVTATGLTIRSTTTGTKTGNAVLEWRGKDNKWNPIKTLTTLPDTTDYTNNLWAPGWEVWVRARDAAGQTPEQYVKLTADAPPASNPIVSQKITIENTFKDHTTQTTTAITPVS